MLVITGQLLRPFQYSPPKLAVNQPDGAGNAGEGVATSEAPCQSKEFKYTCVGKILT